MNPAVIVQRTKAVIATLGGTVPDDAAIRAEIDVDQRFIGEDYAVPSPESTAAIRELARNEGIFVGPVYTGIGIADLLDHARTGKIPAGTQRRLPPHRRHRQPVRARPSRRRHHALSPRHTDIRLI